MSYTRDRKLFSEEDEKFLKALRIASHGPETVAQIDHDEAIAAYLCQTADQPEPALRAEQEAEFHRRTRHYYIGAFLIGFGAWALGRLIFG